MFFKRWTGALALMVVGTVAAGAQGQAQNYVYTRGPNYVNMSASRCRVGAVSAQASLWHGLAATGVSSGTSTFYCPIQRRGTAYYEDYSTVDAKFLNVSMTALTVSAQEYNASSSLSCTPFARSTGGSTSYGTTRYLCGTTGGCTTAPAASWQGSGALTWSSTPIPTSSSTVNWGFYCTASSSTSLHHYQATISAN